MLDVFLDNWPVVMAWACLAAAVAAAGYFARR